MKVQSADYTLRMQDVDIGQLPPLFCEAHLTEEKLRLGERVASSNSGLFHSVLRPFSVSPFSNPHSAGGGEGCCLLLPKNALWAGGGSEASSKEENRGSPDQILKDWW